jgi:hypothetical protein
MNTPKQYNYRILCHRKFGLENSIYDMKWGAHTLGTFLLLDFKILDFYRSIPKQLRKLFETRSDGEIAAGLPDGIFSYQKSQFGYILEGLGMENIDS